jgi:hypothetical protein
LVAASLPSPSAKPTNKVKPRYQKRGKRFSGPKLSKQAATTPVEGTNDELDNENSERRRPNLFVPKGDDTSVFKPTCAKLSIYDSTTKGRSIVSEVSLISSNDKPRNLREHMADRSLSENDREEKLTTGRAARANQRRVMKDVASFGATTSLAVDTLASREPQLRFGRSGIHAWGVFADEDIASGEMIVEYRGVLIGSAIAERREKEYEVAKIGSDYMFRIDAQSVCDATKEGNVARFINACCEPNCFTKIITLDGNKRIVIYAKRDINAGEELCYDYKFPLEYDVSKRIPCHCGARECRGFMNWVSSCTSMCGAAQMIFLTIFVYLNRTNATLLFQTTRPTRSTQLLQVLQHQFKRLRSKTKAM